MRHQIFPIHGSVYEIKCSRGDCSFKGRNTCSGSILYCANDTSRDSSVSRKPEVPVCFRCKAGLLRPGVVWFGEKLPSDLYEDINNWLSADEQIDLVLVVGTDRTPFVYDALQKEAKLAWINKFDEAEIDEDLGDADWVENGDCSDTLPRLISATLEA